MFNKSLQDKADDFLLKMVKEQQIPGAVYAVITKDTTIAENAVGLAHKDIKIPMRLDTVFDVASLTKVCATLPAVFLLIQNGDIDLDDPVQRFYPETAASELTIKHLLTHTSGLPAHVPFYKLQLNKHEILQSIISSQADPGKQVVYSDLNFILLGFIIEKITGCSLDQFANRYIYDPLNMTNTGFNIKRGKESIAPTEWIDAKQDYQWGAVHDENAFHMGGVSGHAGLFSNLHDLKIYVQMLLSDGYTPSGECFLPKVLLRESRRNFTESLNLNRGLGWQLVDDEFSPSGYFLSRKSYGHTGFTGTSFWIDPEKEIGIILLSNRVHISRSINMNRIRRILHNLVVFSIQ
ncbi:MAG: serine hydrolase domain-containing protein [Tuberibacillus sp.]